MNNYSTQKTRALFAGFFLAIIIGTPAFADDTEIFTGTTASTNVRPNVLFVLDTSSSMITIDSGETETRLDRMKSALNSILDSVTNVNVGLMRFSGSNSGGPVLFPTSYVDDDICDIEDCSTSGSSIAVRVSESADDAEEDSAAGAMDLTDTSIDMVEEGSGGVSGCSTTGTLHENNSSVNDTEEQSDGSLYSSSSDLEFLYDDSRGLQSAVGVRFVNVAVPKNATINCAEIVFEVDEAGSGTVDLDIFGDDSNDSNDWASSPVNRKPSGRTQTSAKVDWNITDNPAVGAELRTPELTTIVQEIVLRGGWSTGNDMAFMFFLDADSGSATSDASNNRIVESEEGGSGPKLRVYYDTTTTTSTSTNTVGLRFQDVQIPQGVTITSASLEFEVEASNGETTNLSIAGNDVDDAAAFSTTAYDITGRTRTSASVAWSTVSSWSTSDDHQSSPDITNIVQEIVNRTGWCGGQNMAMLISGSGKRAATSFDGTSGDAPLLRVTYDPATIPAAGGCINTTYTKTVNSSSNDAEESKTDNTVSISSSDLELSEDGSNEQYVGLRFTGLDISQGATILSANIEFEVDVQRSGTLAVSIKGEANDDASSFSASPTNISSRSTTSASVAWSISDNPAVDASLTSPDITSVVQEIVNRAGWTNGSDMAFILEKTSGTGIRELESYDGESGGAARLTVQVQWDAGSSSSATQTVRQRLKQEVNDLEYKSGTPIVDALYEAALYFKGGAVDYGKVRGTSASSTSRSEYTRVSHPASYTGGTVSRAASCTDADLNNTACKTEAINGSPVYTSPITDTCQTNHIVLLTDGSPSSNSAATKARTMAGISSCAQSGNQACGPELAKYLFENDQSGQSGTQNIITYTIGFAYGDTWIQNIASEGGGSYSTATSAADLANVFNTILADITTTTSSFVAPGAAVNQFNRLRHNNDIYFSLFKPNTQPLWLGNLKKYEIDETTLVIEDMNGAEAVDQTTGFFKNSAQSFWSSSADGNEIDQGGAAGERSLTRNTYTYMDKTATTTTPYSSPISLTDTANQLHETNTAILDTDLGLTAGDTTGRTNILQWARGIDLKDYDEDTNTSEVRSQLADPLHSRPVIVTYGGTSASPDNVVFVATNEGFLYALDPDDGTEFFSYIPYELIPNLKTLYNNSSSDSHPYGLDGYISVWVNDVNDDNNISTADGDHVYVYVGMRRGGDYYYALDVTDYTAPKLLWKIDGGSGGTTGYTELGETWSAPIKAKVDIDGTVTDVLIFGGGYDDDQDSNTTTQVDNLGRAIFMVNATTGAIEWWGSSASGADETFSDMDYSFPGNVRVIDYNQDGLADMMYAADMGGQIWRFDITNGNRANQLVQGVVLADISVDGSTTANRRFYTTPDIARVKEDSTQFYSVSIGTGWRAHPLDTAVDNRFYMIRDTNFNTAPALTGGSAWVTLTESDLYDVTNDIDASSVATAIAGGKDGWYIRLENSGEKVLSDSVTINYQVVFSTYTPTASTSSCSAAQGTGRTYSVDVYNGTPTIDHDGSSSLTKTDRQVELKRGGIPPKPTVLMLPDPIVLIGPETPLTDMTFGDLSNRTYWYIEDN